MKTLNESKVGVIGLGYVGLPLAVAIADKYPVIGLDINEKRVRELNDLVDSTLELDSSALSRVLSETDKLSRGIYITNKSDYLFDCNIFIVTVPTPTDKNNRPVLTPMIEASKVVAKYLKKGDIVVFESTVYPGVTEDEMAPILENFSGLKYNVDFFCGYSPERINPGDKEHTVTKILKITSGSTHEVAEFIDEFYRSIITAGTHKAPSIKVAEAAKVIENSQRDINIAFVNELSMIFNLMGIDTKDVLDAAGTKWNFLNFKPGLVGGHCIGVDPYYLAQKAQEIGYHPEIILAGRRLNDSMGKYVGNQVVKLMIKKGIKVIQSNVLLMGITFKENCPDIRNTKVIDIIQELKSFDINVEVYDPIANEFDLIKEYDINLIHQPKKHHYDAVVLSVAHESFRNVNVSDFRKTNSVVYDIKGFLKFDQCDARL